MTLPSPMLRLQATVVWVVAETVGPQRVPTQGPSYREGIDRDPPCGPEPTMADGSLAEPPLRETSCWANVGN